MNTHNLFIILLLLLAHTVKAQQQEWAAPYVGYTNTHSVAIDAVEFKKDKTVLHTTVSAPSGSQFWVSADAYISDGNSKYALRKVTKLGIDKPYVMPENGKVHFEMQFEPLPENTRVFHFAEGNSATGWRLCNISQSKNDITYEVPAEWQNVEYPRLRTLPRSKPSEDSTTVKVRMLNYVPEAGQTLTVNVTYPIFDDRNNIRTFDITPDGTATIGLQTGFPMTISMRLKGGSDFPLLVVPGEDSEILLDLAKGGGTPIAAFKGALSTVNYELNVLGGNDSVQYDNSDAYFDALISSGEKPGLLSSSRFDPLNFCGATREWLWMENEALFMKHKQHFERYMRKRLRSELSAAGSPLADKWDISRFISIYQRETDTYTPISTSETMTLCPDFRSVCKEDLEQGGNRSSSYNRDIDMLFEALLYNERISYESGARLAQKIQAPDIKAFYHRMAKRWQDYIAGINATPHLHYESERQTDNTEALRDSILRTYRGKNIVLLVYSRHEKNTSHELDELEQLMRESESKNTVFLHIDISPYGLQNWHEAALKRSGEHYTGRLTSFIFQPSDYYSTRQGGPIYYEFYSPDGTMTLSTYDKGIATENIKKMP